MNIEVYTVHTYTLSSLIYVF